MSLTEADPLEHRKHDGGGHDGAYLAAGVGADRMHAHQLRVMSQRLTSVPPMPTTVIANPNVFGELFRVPPELEYEYLVANIHVKDQKLKPFLDKTQVEEFHYTLR